MILALCFGTVERSSSLSVIQLKSTIVLHTTDILVLLLRILAYLVAELVVSNLYPGLLSLHSTDNWKSKLLRCFGLPISILTRIIIITLFQSVSQSVSSVTL